MEQLKCAGCPTIIGVVFAESFAAYCLSCAEKKVAIDAIPTISANEAGLLTEINDGSRGWRAGCSSLLLKGFITKVTYANGDHAELTSRGHFVIDEFEKGDYSRISRRQAKLKVVQ